MSSQAEESTGREEAGVLSIATIQEMIAKTREEIDVAKLEEKTLAGLLEMAVKEAKELEALKKNVARMREALLIIQRGEPAQQETAKPKVGKRKQDFADMDDKAREKLAAQRARRNARAKELRDNKKMAKQAAEVNDNEVDVFDVPPPTPTELPGYYTGEDDTA